MAHDQQAAPVDQVGEDPAGKQNRKADSVVAVWISATISGDRVRLVISQAAATFCIQTLMFATSVQIQTVR